MAAEAFLQAPFQWGFLRREPLNRPKGIFFDLTWAKNLKTFTPPNGFLGLEIPTATAESQWGLGFVYIIFLYLIPVKVALFFSFYT
jgi:hypothetical protein